MAIKVTFDAYLGESPNEQLKKFELVDDDGDPDNVQLYIKGQEGPYKISAFDLFRAVLAFRWSFKSDLTKT